MCIDEWTPTVKFNLRNNLVIKVTEKITYLEIIHFANTFERSNSNTKMYNYVKEILFIYLVVLNLSFSQVVG